MRDFYQLPTKIVLIVLFLTWLGVSATTRPAIAYERVPLMDLEKGAVDFFIEIVPSIVEIYVGGSGSGYIIDREGHLITNAHVTSGNEAFEIAFYGDEKFSRGYEFGRWKGTLVAEDLAVDLAIIRVEAPPEKFYPVRLGDSALVKAGDTCATFGSPGGDPGWVDRSFEAIHDSWLEFYNLNLGVITEVLSFEEAYWTAQEFFYDQEANVRSGGRNYGSALEYLFHTDSAINAGNSGGPCLNVYGEAIGTNTWGWGGENVGMSVPVNLLKKSVTDMLEYGRVRRPWCGIALHPSVVPQRQIETQMSIGTFDRPIGTPWDSTPDVMKIHDVNPYSPAYEAGVRIGDVLIRVDGKTYENVFDVYSYFLNRELGDEVVLEVERDGLPMPPMRVVIGEKKVRYHGRDIYLQGAGRYFGQFTAYTDNMTY